MKENFFSIDRRKFLQTSAMAAGVMAVAPLQVACTATTQQEVNRSNFGGVQLGAITYSFRSMPTSPGDVLAYSLASGLGSLEMMGDVAESYAGRPASPPRQGGGMPRQAPGEPQPQLTPAQQREQEEARAAQAEATRLFNESVLAWRRSVPMSKYEELAKIYKMAGINIHLLKLQPSANSTDEELDYMFNVCKAVGAEGLCTELSPQVAERVQPFAAKHGKYMVFHQHQQFSDDPRYNPDRSGNGSNLDFIKGGGYDAYLKYDNVRFNFDMGHYFGSTGKDPREIVEKYHERIFTCHVKDKTGPDSTDPQGYFNKPWGQGDTPLKEFLLYIQSNAGKPGWPVHCDIELEYNIPEGSNAVIETRRCVEWARNVLVNK